MTDANAALAGESGPDLSRVLIALYKGVVYAHSHPQLWQSLQRFRTRVSDHVGMLGLELMIDESEGHAYLRQRPRDDEEDLPRLVPRRQLSYPVSLLLALLRKKLAEHDAGGGETRLILSRDEIVDMIRLFLPQTADEARMVQRVDTHINKVVELGFLRRLRGQNERFEVQRILKGFVDAQWLSDLNARLAEYRAHAAGEDVHRAAAGEPGGGDDADIAGDEHDG